MSKSYPQSSPHIQTHALSKADFKSKENYLHTSEKTSNVDKEWYCTIEERGRNKASCALVLWERILSMYSQRQEHRFYTLVMAALTFQLVTMNNTAKE